MRALQASGQRNAALEVYERTRKRLAEQLGTDPSAELAALHLEMLRAEEPAGKPRSNLPAALTSFIGRESELNQVAGLLGVHRLVTLTGPGGAGKTRLAIETAANQLATMPDGAWLVELAAVTDAAEVAQAMLDALGLREQALLRTAMASRNTDPVGRLIAALASKRMLLVLDNCEHLIDAAAALAGRVLAACPQVRILATSREPLNITGEALLPVGSLALPSATMLLRQRARAVSLGLAADLEGAEPTLTRICQALDGMPLAIELAAARMRTMGAEQVQARLADRFWLLTGGSRTALPRHQTLRAVVDWSWDLLSEAEQTLWHRFSVFTGGATLEAAEQVCADGPIQAHDVLDLITSLIDKSIITVRAGHGRPGQERAGQRYSMLEITRRSAPRFRPPGQETAPVPTPPSH
jgi:predicted ATPase